MLVDIGVLIYFIHHIAKSIQLPEVIAGIAQDLMQSIDAEFPDRLGASVEPVSHLHAGKSVPELLLLIDERGAEVPSQVSGYIQYVGYSQLIAIATRTDSVIRLEHRPGHYLAEGRALAMVWPRGAAHEVALALSKAHVTGPHRTLVQDPVFAIDQLVEIAIRALSAAVNDTFTALTCIDWLSAGLGRVSGRVLDEGVYRDGNGNIRLIESDPSYARMVNRSFDKIRQAAPGHAGGPHPAHRLAGLDHAGHHVPGPAGGAAAPGGHGASAGRGDGHRAERPGGDQVPVPAHAR